MKKIVLLIDCYAFYCSCERVLKPSLKHTPIGVLSNNDGCVISRTQELKSLGIAMGEPYFKVKHLMTQKKAQFFSANFELYTDFSKRVFNTLKELVSKVEVYSIDEAFAEYSYTHPSQLSDKVQEIYHTIFSYTRIPVRIGIGSTKTLAKLAIEVIKLQKDHSHFFYLSQENDLDYWLSNIPIRNVWGIGPKKAIKLSSIGLKTALDLKRYPHDKKIQKLLTKTGRQTQDEIRGISCSPVFSLEDQFKKGISVTRSFGQPVYSKDELKASLSFHIMKAAEKLREQRSLCQEISFFARTSHFTNSPFGLIKGYYRFQEPTNHTGSMIQVIHTLVDQYFQSGTSYKKSGVFLGDLYAEFQPCLFSKSSLYTKQQNLMNVMDSINKHYSKTVLYPLACYQKKRPNWAMRQQHLSPRATTAWSEIAQTG